MYKHIYTNNKQTNKNKTNTRTTVNLPESGEQRSIEAINNNNNNNNLLAKCNRIKCRMRYNVLPIHTHFHANGIE